MKISEVRELDNAALLETIESKREELFRLRLNWYNNTLEDPNQMTTVRKDIARMLTILRERELAASYIGGEGNAE
jgi:large subunit ribosomal protein L29